jgi:signal peptidase II
LVVLGALAVVALVALLMRRRPRPRVVEAALVLVTAGAIGNYLDRLTRGYVIDFVHLHHWPVFNVADVYVTGGAALLAVLSIFVRGERPRHAIERPPT